MLLCAWNIIIIICNSALGKKKEWKYICTTVKKLNSIIIFLLSQEFCELYYFTVGYGLQFIRKLIKMDRELIFSGIDKKKQIPYTS